MRGLTLHRPWDWAMALGGKDIENRTWPPPAMALGGARIALHAGQTNDEQGAQTIRAILGLTEVPKSAPSVIVATTRVVGWVLLAHDPSESSSVVHSTSEMAPGVIAEALASPWLFGPYAWVCRDTVALPEPVQCRGAQKLWLLAPHVEREVLRQEQQARSKSA